MRTFLIDEESFKVAKVVDGDVSDSTHAESLIRVKTKASLKKLSGPQLVGIYNATGPAKPNKSPFRDKDTGIEKTWAALQEKYPETETSDGKKKKSKPRGEKHITFVKDAPKKRAEGDAKQIYDVIKAAGKKGITMTALKAKLPSIDSKRFSICIWHGAKAGWAKVEQVDAKK